MRIKETVPSLEKAGARVNRKTQLDEAVGHGRAHLLVAHRRPKDWKRDPETGLDMPVLRFKTDPRTGLAVPDEDCFDLLLEDESWNLITNAGRDFLHLQGYGTSGLGANGLNYIALSDDTVTETSTSTTLSTEIAANGLSRAQGTVAHTSGTNTTTVDKTFTCTTTTQKAQKAALFTAASVGIMNHVLAFTERTLIPGDTLEVTFTITLG